MRSRAVVGPSTPTAMHPRADLRALLALLRREHELIEIDAVVDTSRHLPAKVAAMRAHATQVTVAPDGTAWMREMRAGADAVKKDTGDRVEIKFYPGGVMGDEPTVMRKIRIGQLQGGLLSVVGLREIEPSIAALQAQRALHAEPWGAIGLAHERLDYGALVVQADRIGLLWRDAAGMDQSRAVTLGADTRAAYSAAPLGVDRLAVIHIPVEVVIVGGMVDDEIAERLGARRRTPPVGKIRVAAIDDIKAIGGKLVGLRSHRPPGRCEA